MAAPRPAREHRPRRRDDIREVFARRRFRASTAPVDDNPLDLATHVVALSVTKRRREFMLGYYRFLPYL